MRKGEIVEFDFFGVYGDIFQIWLIFFSTKLQMTFDFWPWFWVKVVGNQQKCGFLDKIRKGKIVEFDFCGVYGDILKIVLIYVKKMQMTFDFCWKCEYLM